jgi:hypothetical protein
LLEGQPPGQQRFHWIKPRYSAPESSLFRFIWQANNGLTNDRLTSMTADIEGQVLMRSCQFSGKRIPEFFW